MKLSILTCSIPERDFKIPDCPDWVEWLVLTDNKKRSIGKKREALLKIAQGEYVMWVDDDDELLPEFFEKIKLALHANTDIVCFEHEAWINGLKYIISTSRHNENEQLHDKGTVKRKPYTSDVWRRELVQDIEFEDIMYGEDYKWSAKALERADTEAIVPTPLHKYIYEDSETAAIEVKRETKPKTCVISFSSKGREDYNKALLGMIDSVKDKAPEIDILVYSPDHDKKEHNGVTIHKWEGTSHKEIPYGFKPELFLEAAAKGYEQVIWMDSTVRLLRHPQKALDYAGTNGFAVYDNIGHPLKPYIDNHAIKNLEIGSEELDECPQIMACVIVMDLRHDHVKKVLLEWHQQMDEGSFNETEGAEKGHRHDQAVLSYLLWKNQQVFLPYGQLCYPPHHETGEHEVIFLNKGIK